MAWHTVGCGPWHGTECGTGGGTPHSVAQGTGHIRPWCHHRAWHCQECAVPWYGTGYRTPCATCHSPDWVIATATLRAGSCSLARPPAATSPSESKILRPGHVSPWSHSFPVGALCTARTAGLCGQHCSLSQSREQRHRDGHRSHPGTFVLGQCHHEAARASLACCG